MKSILMTLDVFEKKRLRRLAEWRAAKINKKYWFIDEVIFNVKTNKSN
jgi:hypothetical protein